MGTGAQRADAQGRDLGLGANAVAGAGMNLNASLSVDQGALVDERRYARQIALPEVGVAGQRRLAGARVLVVGAGGLGSVSATYLAAAGVGVVGIIDDDVVEESNLHRQVIHDSTHLGMAKVDSAAHRLRAVNPRVRVETHRMRLSAENAVDLVARYDVVVDGADNFATRYVVADATVLTGRPQVWGSILRFAGQVSVWSPPAGPCYRCVFPQPPPPDSVASCAEAGVLGSLCAAIGAAQSTEALKLLLGVGEPLIGRLQLHDALRAEWDTIPVRRNPACPLCGEAPSITAPRDEGGGAVRGRLSADALAQLLADDPDVVLIDIRQPDEWASGVIPGARLVPLAQLSTLRIEPGRRVVAYCASGGRSVAAVAALRDAGYAQVTDLAGGVEAWRTAYGLVNPAG